MFKNAAAPSVTTLWPLPSDLNDDCNYILSYREAVLFLVSKKVLSPIIFVLYLKNNNLCVKIQVAFFPSMP